MGEQVVCDEIELANVLTQEGLGGVVRLGDDGVDLLVDHRGNCLGVVGIGGEVTAEEHLVLVGTEAARAELLGHTEQGDHTLGGGGGILNVGVCTACDVTEDDLLGGTSAQCHGDLVFVVPLIHLIAVCLGAEAGVAQRTATRGHDGDHMNGVTATQVADNGVSRLVVSGVLLFGIAHHAGLLLGTHDDLVEGVLDLVHANEGLAVAGGEQSGLVEEVGKVSTRKSDRDLCHAGKIHTGLQGLVAGVDLQDVLAAADVGTVDLDLTVKAAGTEQSGVKHVGTVGGGDDHDALVRAEAVHFHEQLVEGLLTLVVTAAKACASLATDGIDLVDEDDGRACLAGGLKEVADAGSTHTDVHLYEIRARDGEEGNACLACNGLGQQGLTRTGRAHEQDTVRNFCPEGGVLGGSLEVIHDLHQLLFFLVCTCHVAEGDLVLVVGELDVRLTEAAHLATGACVHHTLHSEDVQEDEGDHHDHTGQERDPPGEGVGRGVFKGVENGHARAVLHLGVYDGHDLLAGAGDVGQLVGLLGR